MSEDQRGYQEGWDDAVKCMRAYFRAPDQRYGDPEIMAEVARIVNEAVASHVGHARGGRR